MKRYIFYLLTVLSFGAQAIAQNKPITLAQLQENYKLDSDQPFMDRITRTPDDVLKMFRDTGMLPTAHALTDEERKIVAEAFSVLPPLHQRVLKQHLKSISFLDNMPNTALTSPVTKDGEVNLYHITFRAGILHQTISEWVTEKERTCFTKDSTTSVTIQAGLMSALTYVMLHEGTHVVDGSVGLHQTAFTKGLWKTINTPDRSFPDSITMKSYFRRGGRKFHPDEAVRVYRALAQTPFVSFYSTASWGEDLAELLTIYHLTSALKQPFRVVVQKDGKPVHAFEPMNSPSVRQRFSALQVFYAKK